MGISLWLSVPAFQPTPQIARGSSAKSKVCLGICSDVLTVQNLAIACNADLLGVSYSCEENMLRPGHVEATYVRLPSLASLVGLSRIDGTLVGLQRDGEVVYLSSVSDHVWHAAYGGWVFNAIYWPIVGLVAWRWPKSWLVRRVRPKSPKNQREA
jgi:hypothetical protein